MNNFTLLFLAALLTATALQLYLDWRQVRHVRAHRERVPDAFAGRIDLGTHRKAADYTVARTRTAMIDTGYAALLLLGWTLAGGLAAVDALWRQADFGPLVTGTGVVISAVLIMALLELPFTVWRTFRVEQRYGFNRTKPRLFFIDLIKQGLLMLALGGPLTVLVLWLMDAGHDPTAADYGNEGWWFWVWLVWMTFNLLIMWAFPRYIAPLFNTFQPLEDEALARRIEGLLARCGFRSNGIFVMDGSRRSTHGNAYFGGLGSNKRIVFFDTLLKSLDHDEIEAVLAHELGHFRRRHVLKRVLTLGVTSLVGLALLGWLMRQPWFYQGLGVGESSVHTALLLFLLTAPVFTFFLQPIMAATLRRHEFEADDFAAEQASASKLTQALVKLYRDNASTLTPDPWHSAYHDSHPPAPIRIAHLANKAT